MNIIPIVFTVAVMLTVVFEFNANDRNIQVSDDTLAMDSKRLIHEAKFDFGLILLIIIFGIWGIFTTLGLYNF